MKILLAIIVCVVLAGCVSVRRYSSGPWAFPDYKYRTVHYRADLGKWQSWQYSDNYWDAENHRSWMAGLFKTIGSNQPTAIECRPRE